MLAGPPHSLRVLLMVILWRVMRTLQWPSSVCDGNSSRAEATSFSNTIPSSTYGLHSPSLDPTDDDRPSSPACEDTERTSE